MTSWGVPKATPEQLRDLFVHRDDVYALQRETGEYYPVNAPVTDEVLAKHLRGKHTVGLYQLATDNTVKWVCWDLDTEDPAARKHLVNCVQGFVSSLDLPMGHLHDYRRCLLLEDSNGQGRTHVWLFLSEPLPAAQVRAWVAQDFMSLWQRDPHVADGVTVLNNEWPLEVFPKQDALTDGGYGNLVRLPLGVNRKNGKRSRIVGHPGSDSLNSVWKFDSGLVPRYEGRASALLPGRSQGGRVVGDSATARLRRGEVREGERNNTFAAAAWHLRQEGLDEDLAEEQLARWNRQLPEPLEDRELLRTIHGAFKKTADIEPNQRTAPRTKKDLYALPPD